MRKPSVLVGLVAGAMLIFAGVNYYMQVVVTRDSYAQYILKSELRLKSAIDISKAMGQAGLWDDLRARLEDLRQDQFIDFYILQYRDQPVWWASLHGNLAEVQTHYDIIGQPVRQETKGENPIYQTTAFGPEFKLTIGFIRDRDAYVAMTMKRYRAFNIEEWVFFGLIVLGVGIWSLRDLLLMAFRMSRGDTTNFFRLKTNSRESDLLARSLNGFASTVEKLGKANDVLDRQVLPALKKELLSGRKPPYDFGCTLVRVDINRFTDIYNNHDVRALMASINDFFIDVSHVVSRYDGLISEFIGDEVIFYFKDDASPQSTLTALSALRDISAIAERYDATLRKERGYGFTIKSSLAHGSLHFGPLVNGFSLAGAVLIETVRILSLVTEKDQNSIFFEARHQCDVQRLCLSQDVGEFQLKGFKEARSVFTYVEHVPLQRVLLELTPSTTSDLLYYRSDESLLQILRWLRDPATSVDVALAAVMTLRQFSLTVTSSELIENVFAWLEEMKRQPERAQLYAAAIAWLPKLIPHSQWIFSYENRLASLLRGAEPRAYATIIEVLGSFNSTQSVTALSEMTDDPKWRRARINALVRRGKLDIDKTLVRDIKVFLSGTDEYGIAGAIYAIGEIAEYHLAKDRIYFITRVEFLKLLETVVALTSSKSQIVSAQALKVCEKLPESAWRPSWVSIKNSA